jgi:hypothetical protein
MYFCDNPTCRHHVEVRYCEREYRDYDERCRTHVIRCEILLAPSGKQVRLCRECYDAYHFIRKLTTEEE